MPRSLSRAALCQRARSSAALLLLATLSTAALPGPARAGSDLAEQFAQLVTIGDLRTHLHALQDIARANGDTRASGTKGYKQSANYVARKLKKAGYDVEVQPFAYLLYEEHSPPVLNRLSPTSETYVPDEDFASMTYSGAGDVTGTLVPAAGIVIPPTEQPSSASGCAASDFPAETAGNVALVQRGACDFSVKAANAIAAGATAVIIFNEGNSSDQSRIDMYFGTLGGPVAVPVLSTSFPVGEELYQLTQSGPVTVRVKVDATTIEDETVNVIGTTWIGNPDHAIVVGAHLDSVPEGPGINDNGSGVAAVLQIAENLSRFQTGELKNQIRFAFWGAEELGLFGSTYYVGSLRKKARARIALNLNFDMLASPNYVRFVYDGDGDIGPKGPKGSGEIENVLVRYFARHGLKTEPTAFDGRSDYGPFIEAGIPAGGLFSGAEEIKTKKQAKIYGGEAGIAYDACYHQRCDTMRNINNEGFLQLARGAAYATYVMAKRPFAPDRGLDELAASKLDLKYRGNRLRR
jgi:Zn-dependent M28 family amino/carboxypeptidase